MSDDVRDELVALFRSDPESMLRTMDAWARDSRIAQSIEALTDSEVAGVIGQITTGCEMDESVLTLWIAVAGRLRRAGGDAYRSCSWCISEAREQIADGTRDDGQWWCGSCEKES